MFVGHYAAAMAAKAIEPKAPMWTLAAAAQLVDIGWSAFIVTGIEHARVDPTLPGSTLVLEYMPWTHSLPAALAWSVGAALPVRLFLPLWASVAVGLNKVVMRIKTMLYVIWGLALMTSLSLPFLPQISQPADSSIFFGRFHIVFLHFPVVLVLLASALILWNYFSAGFQAGRQVSIQITSSLLLLALISVFASVFTDFLLYQGGDYGGKLVTQHLYGGVVLSLLMSGAVYVQLCIPKEKLKQWALLTLLGVSVIVVVFTGHAGGSLTHGEEFLSAYKPLWFAKPTALSTKPQSEILWYEDLVQPILEDKCLSCHNEHKTKGGLLMSNWDNLIKGGKSGKTMLIARVPDSSELYLRTILPLDHDDHMPPTERPQLTSDELFIIHQWIKKGGGIRCYIKEHLPKKLKDSFLK